MMTFPYLLPLFVSRVQAGFPSPADDYQEGSLDLNEYLIQHPAATFFVRVSGNSMIDAGIAPNDLLIVDRSLKPTFGRIVVAVIENEFTVKRYIRINKQYWLKAENKDYSSIKITDTLDFSIWGVVTYVIHSV